MNIYLREMKSHRWGLVFWSFGMLAMVSSGMAKYSAYEDAGQSLQDMLSQIPRAVQTVFGMTGFDLSTAGGFYGMLFLYLAVMGAVHAALLGATVISKEERDRTSEFLYAKPISRGYALTAKLLAGLTNVVLLNLVTFASSVYFVDYFNKGPSINSDIALLMAGLLFLQVIFLSIGAVVAGFVKRPKAAPSISTNVMFLTFLISYLVNMNEKLEFLKYFTPFKYFDAAVVMADGRLDLGYIALSVAIVALAVFGTYHYYTARDLTV